MKKLLLASLVGVVAFSEYTVPSTAQIASPTETVAQIESCMRMCLNTKKSREACKARCQSRPGS
jgi:hypothetical protein